MNEILSLTWQVSARQAAGETATDAAASSSVDEDVIDRPTTRGPAIHRSEYV